ncbi:hypothetical protein JML65_05815 [Chryseobacterium sp. KMC2]|nr:hypothetical protein [Chryseobacterium sp. KMC2]
MSRNYKFHNPEGLYFISFAVVGRDNKPIELWSNKVIRQKINYIHQNPIEAGLVFRAEDCSYSSAIDYADEKGLLDDIVVFRMFD